MKPSSFQERIEHQFDFICMRAMDDERKNYFLYLSRLAKREVSFSDIGDYLVNQFATTDSYSSDFQIFTLNDISVGIENDLLSEALKELPDKKREILLLFYFMDMSDSEIADLLKLNRSTVYRHRTSGLDLIKKFMEEENEDKASEAVILTLSQCFMKNMSIQQDESETRQRIYRNWIDSVMGKVH